MGSQEGHSAHLLIQPRSARFTASTPSPPEIALSIYGDRSHPLTSSPPRLDGPHNRLAPLAQFFEDWSTPNPPCQAITRTNTSPPNTPHHCRGGQVHRYIYFRLHAQIGSAPPHSADLLDSHRPSRRSNLQDPCRQMGSATAHSAHLLIQPRSARFTPSHTTPSPPEICLCIQRNRATSVAL
jgi:hypothetical protein